MWRSVKRKHFKFLTTQHALKDIQDENISSVALRIRSEFVRRNQGIKMNQQQTLISHSPPAKVLNSLVLDGVNSMQ